MNTKIILSITTAVWLLLASCTQSYSEIIITPYAELKIDQTGNICQVVDKSSGINYISNQAPSPVLKLYNGNEYILPTGFKAEEDKWILTFENGSEAIITKEIKGNYIRLSLQSLTNRDSITAVAWGPYATIFSQYIGETVGVVRDSVFAIGIQALDLFTTEGQPHLGDDASGGTYIDPLPGQVVPDDIKDQIGKKIDFINVNVEGDMPEYVRNWRGNAAIRKPYGSDLQFFARNWKAPCTIELYGRKQYVEPVDQDYIGSSITLFACPSLNTLDVIEEIELGEGLPHPMIDGVWIKRWNKANQAYMLYEGNSLDNALNYADSCNFSLVHIGDIFKSWGHFDLHSDRFPEGAKQISNFTAKAKERGISVGVHTLTMFTSQHDPYITPIPSDSLCTAGSSTLLGDINETDMEIRIESPEFFIYTGPTRTAKIGKELIAYREVSKEQPYRLLGCTRGQFGTKATAHKAGTSVEKLVNDDYSGFFPNIKLQDTYAERLAEVCKETGIDLMDFDGYGGGSPTGHGCFGAGRFANRWYNELDQYRITCGAGTFHSYWHIYTFMNWGEPWYDNLRESQINYRLENQRYFERNLMPGMLGWFKLESTYRPEDIEWIQARSAAFDAGYLLRVDESIEQNGFKCLLFEAIREWQKARNSHAFSTAQLERMKNPKNEFHLEKTGTDSWNLYDVILDGKNEHKYRLVQAGEPLQSRFSFNNPYESQSLQFYLDIKPGEEANGTISNLKLEIGANDPIIISETLTAGNKVYCDGKAVYICDSFWNTRSKITLPSAPEWKKGENNVAVQCAFSSSKAPLLNLEFKAYGNLEEIKSN